MKDYVFIGWSKNRELAIEVKALLDRNGFIGVVGGSYENNPLSIRLRKSTVNETVNYQMSHCDQAILLFQKIDDNLSISGNLIYELGYITSQYNYIGTSTNLHIFKIDITQADDNLFPSDLHGVWGEQIKTEDKTSGEVAAEIVAQFLKNQSQIKNKEKFRLLNDYHTVEFELMKHFDNPTMSDYDLAKDLLVYQQAAFCYQEQSDISLKIHRFKSKMLDKECGTRELRWAVDYAELTLDLFCKTIPDAETLSINMDGKTFRDILNRYRDIAESVCEAFSEYFEDEELKNIVLTDEFIRENEFEALLIAQVQEHISYLVLVYMFSGGLAESERIKYSKEGIDYCHIAIRNLELFSNYPESEMYVKVMLSYAFKNLSTFCANLGDMQSSAKYGKKSYKLRRAINNYIKHIPFMRPSLKDYFTLEYLMQVVEIIKDCEDEYMIADYMQEIEAYLNQRAVTDSVRDLLINTLRSEFVKLKNKTKTE